MLRAMRDRTYAITKHRQTYESYLNTYLLYLFPYFILTPLRCAGMAPFARLHCLPLRTHHPGAIAALHRPLLPPVILPLYRRARRARGSFVAWISIAALRFAWAVPLPSENCCPAQPG